jgi:phospholipid/cholesterol/gamma-HCH transport system ATP-binding protein
MAQVFRMDQVTLRFDDRAAGRVCHADLRLGSGQVICVRVPSHAWLGQLADAMCGLIEPESGTVRFAQQDWQEVSPDRVAVLRSAIGRVHAAANWISYLSVLENVILAPMHHSSRPRGYWIEQATDLAVQFGLPGLPLDRPDHLRDLDLRGAACVRAFLGSPRLIILEQPIDQETDPMFCPLINQIRLACGSGAAVVWLTTNQAIWNRAGELSWGRYHFAGANMREVRQ